MNSAGNCTVCPNKCHLEKHANLPFHIAERETRTSDQLKMQYETAVTGKEKVQSMIAKNEGTLHDLQVFVFSVIENVRKSIKRLNEIALKPDPLTEVEYLDLLIESEKMEAQLGWKSRVQQYMKLRKDAEMLKKAQKMTAKDSKSKSWWKTFW